MNDDFYFLLGVGILVLLCCIGRALIILAKSKLPVTKSSEDATERTDNAH